MGTESQKTATRNILISQISPLEEERIAWYHHMQKTQPVRFRPEYNLWEVFRYEDVHRVLHDHTTFVTDKYVPEGFPIHLDRTDPQKNRQLRSALSKTFTSRYLEELRPHLTQVIDELLAPAIETGKMDIAAEFAYPLPIRIITNILGSPPSDRERFLQWSYQLIRQFMGVWNADNDELFRYFSDLLERRTDDDSRDGFIGKLLYSEENGAHLTRDETIQLCFELMWTGNVTTTALLIFMFARLCRRPEVYQALHEDPALIPGAIEEIMRYDYGAMNAWRVARYDTVLGGQEIKAGQQVVVWTAAASFDETVFPHAAQFDIRRSPNPHLNFGQGIHACPGSPLARMEARLTLERIVTRFSEMRLDPENPVQYMDQMGSVRIVRSLGVLFTPVGSASHG